MVNFMINENWKPIEGYEGLYEVSDLGNVRSLNYRRTGKPQVLKLSDDSYGYLQINLCKNRERKCSRVNILVAQAFIPNPENKPEVNHKDEDKHNNRVDNLNWCTREENMEWGTCRERITKSLKKTVTQYTNDGVPIKVWDSATQVEIELGINQSSISKCCKGRRKTAGGYIWRYS